MVGATHARHGERDEINVRRWVAGARLSQVDGRAHPVQGDGMPRCFNTMLAGEALGDVPEDNRRHAVDLGLVRRADDGGLEVLHKEHGCPAPVAQGVDDAAWRSVCFALEDLRAASGDRRTPFGAG